MKNKSMENIRRWFENDTINNGQKYEITEYDIKMIKEEYQNYSEYFR